jgi:thymidylate synthase
MKTEWTARGAWLETLRAVLVEGRDLDSRNGGSLEVLGHSVRILDPRSGWIDCAVRKAKLRYACAELLWYLSGTDDGWIKHYAPQYVRFLEEDGTAWGAYGARMARADQLRFVVRELTVRPNSRRAIIAMWMPRLDCPKTLDEGADVPCTLSLQFLLRGNKLNCVATMRSNDAWLGMPYDVFCFTAIQRLVASALRVELGWYQHQVGSMHLYEHNLEKAHQCLQRMQSAGDGQIVGDGPPGWDAMWESVTKALKAEWVARTLGHDTTAEIPHGLMREVAEEVV